MSDTRTDTATTDVTSYLRRQYIKKALFRFYTEEELNARLYPALNLEIKEIEDE